MSITMTVKIEWVQKGEDSREVRRQLCNIATGTARARSRCADASPMREAGTRRSAPAARVHGSASPAEIQAALKRAAPPPQTTLRFKNSARDDAGGPRVVFKAHEARGRQGAKGTLGRGRQSCCLFLKILAAQSRSQSRATLTECHRAQWEA